MGMNMSEEENRTWKDQYMLRFPEGMRDRLKDEAAAKKRSLNAEIIARLEATLEGNLADLSAEGFGALIKRLEATIAVSDALVFALRDSLPGLDRFMVEEGIDRQEAIRRILQDWLIGHGYAEVRETKSDNG